MTDSGIARLLALVEQLCTFPIQRVGRIPWAVAERAYARYAQLHGREQTLQRLAERGGFGLAELGFLLRGYEKRHDSREDDRDWQGACEFATKVILDELAAVLQQAADDKDEDEDEPDYPVGAPLTADQLAEMRACASRIDLRNARLLLEEHGYRVHEGSQPVGALCETCVHLKHFDLAPDLFTCPVVNIRIHATFAKEFGCNQHVPTEVAAVLQRLPLIENAEVTRVDGVPGVGQGDLPRSPRPGDQ